MRRLVAEGVAGAVRVGAAGVLAGLEVRRGRGELAGGSEGPGGSAIKRRINKFLNSTTNCSLKCMKSSMISFLVSLLIRFKFYSGMFILLNTIRLCLCFILN